MRSTSLQKVFDNKLDLYFLLFFVLQPFIDIYKAFWWEKWGFTSAIWC